jgi:hypothetical protein
MSRISGENAMNKPSLNEELIGAIYQLIEAPFLSFDTDMV